MNPIGTSYRPVFYHSTFERARSTITAQDGKHAVIKSYDTSYHITNKICRALSILSGTDVLIHIARSASQALAREQRRDRSLRRLNIKRAQSLGCSSAKLTQGTASELENEAARGVMEGLSVSGG